METPTQELKGKQKIQNEKLSCGWSILFITFFGLCLSTSYIAFVRLPEDRPLTADPEEFSGSKARHYLCGLTSIGPRVGGTNANEETAVNYLLEEIKGIIQEANDLYTIETDVQIVSGKFRNRGILQLYESVQNVIVKLTPKRSHHTNALMVNSHFDTGLTSPGAGDDGSMVAVMLGVLNSLTKSKEAVQHPVIFLLNGAEEKGLHAAHGFITQHKWAKDIKSLINLDAMGVGGKEILMQTGPNNNRLIDYYNKAARHPHGSVLIEEIFETPSFPSGTDFTVFRDVGNLTGLDMIFIKNGYAYHTAMDKFSNLDEGSLQHAGDNLLALVRTLANSEELDENFVTYPTGRGVYFDVLGLFFVNYHESWGIVINFVIAIVSLVVIGVSIWVISRSVDKTFFQIARQFAIIFIIQIASVAFGAGISLGLAYLLNYIGYSFSWFTLQWIMVGLYSCPFVFVTGIVPALFLESNLLNKIPLRFNVMLLQHAQCVLFPVLTFVLYYRSVFIISYTVLFYTISMLINFMTVFQRKAHFWLIPSIICQALPLLMNNYNIFILLTILVPLTGRISGNQELYIAVFVVAATSLTLGLAIPILNVFRKTKSILSIFLVLFVVCLSLVFLATSYVYSEHTPQRQLIYHIARSEYDINGNVTNRSPVFAGYLNDDHVERTLKDVASKNNLKYYTPEDNLQGLGFFVNYFGLIEGYELEIPNRSKLNLVSKEELSSDPGSYRFTFRVDGDAKTLRLSIQALGDNSLVDWSFSLDNEPVDKKMLSATVQFGKFSSSYNFWIIAKKMDSYASTLTIDLNAEYLDEFEQYSDGMNRFFELFPIWTAPTGFLASYDVYEF